MAWNTIPLALFRLNFIWDLEEIFKSYSQAEVKRKTTELLLSWILYLWHLLLLSRIWQTHSFFKIYVYQQIIFSCLILSQQGLGFHLNNLLWRGHQIFRPWFYKGWRHSRWYGQTICKTLFVRTFQKLGKVKGFPPFSLHSLDHPPTVFVELRRVVWGSSLGWMIAWA